MRQIFNKIFIECNNKQYITTEGWGIFRSAFSQTFFWRGHLHILWTHYHRPYYKSYILWTLYYPPRPLRGLLTPRWEPLILIIPDYTCVGLSKSHSTLNTIKSLSRLKSSPVRIPN